MNTEEYILNLMKESKCALENAYSPYSKVKVGAALLCENGEIIKGCNVENCSGSSICAERTAICAAVSKGHRKFKAIAISSNIKDLFITPCGSCRQFLIEFGSSCDVYMCNTELQYKKLTIEELLPSPFSPEVISMEKNKCN